MTGQSFYAEGQVAGAISAAMLGDRLTVAIVGRGEGGTSVVTLSPTDVERMGNWLTDAARSLQDCVDADAERRREVSA